MFELVDLLGGLIGLVLSVGLVVVVGVATQFLHVCRPNEVLIFSGRKHRIDENTTMGYRIVHGGFAWKIPFLEKVDRMGLSTMPIDIEVANAYSQGGIPLTIAAIANVKVSSKKRILPNAIERFQGRNIGEIRRVAKESLEGHIRGVLAQMTPEEVNEDRLKFTKELIAEASEDLDRLGLELDTLKVQSVSDDVEYLDSIGRERLANVIANAKIAESVSQADAEEKEAEANRRGEVAKENAESLINDSANDLRQFQADLEAKARSEEERAQQEAIAARALAEQELQELRAKLEKLRLQSERVLPAIAERKAAEMKARAEAAQIAADGEAMAEVLKMMSETWISAGDDAKDIFLIQQLEQILSTVIERVKELDIGEVTILDNGDGQALPAHIATLPATVASVLRELTATTGVDVTGILAERKGEV
jgi:flotillin